MIVISFIILFIIVFVFFGEEGAVVGSGFQVLGGRFLKGCRI